MPMCPTQRADGLPHLEDAFALLAQLGDAAATFAFGPGSWQIKLLKAHDGVWRQSQFHTALLRAYHHLPNGRLDLGHRESEPDLLNALLAQLPEDKYQESAGRSAIVLWSDEAELILWNIERRFGLQASDLIHNQVEKFWLAGIAFDPRTNQKEIRACRGLILKKWSKMYEARKAAIGVDGTNPPQAILAQRAHLEMRLLTASMGRAQL
jgi:hypothetical protein